MVHVTAFFAALLAFLYLGLTVNVILRRYGLRLTLGDGGDAPMMRNIRAHANFIEYVPLVLVLMVVNELNGKPHWLLAMIGCVVVVARLCHAYSLLVEEVQRVDKVRFRSVGMVGTLASIAVLAVMALL